MRRVFTALLALPALAVLAAGMLSAQQKAAYEKKATREATIIATLKANGLPNLEGKWYYIGPFDNAEKQGFATVYPPEREIDLKKTYKGKGGVEAAWHEFKDFKLAGMNNLARFEKQHNVDSCIYVYHEFEVKEAVELPLSLGSDDTITVWHNNAKILAEDVYRPAAPNQEQVVLKLKPGKNTLLIKVCQGTGDWQLYIHPELTPGLFKAVGQQLAKDFAPGGTAIAKGKAPKASPEAAHYRIVTLPLPKDCVMEVGGLAFRDDGKLVACTRRGEVWLVENPASEELSQVKFKLFAFGLHEALGLHIDKTGIYTVQRPELTKLVPAKDDPDRIAEFVTICDKWGCSGDYHEFAFGLPRDKDGNFFITLNVGFGGGNASRSPYRGWCIKVTPKGDMIPWACGLRSPNGARISPDGDLFYCDNQGEWVATCKMHQIKQGEWYGHPVGLRWVPDSPFAGKIPTKYASGMLYDGQKGQGGVEGMPPFTQPCIWFPYGRCGQSTSEPIWDTTAGKFGPFTGQCIVGDQTTAELFRIDLQKMPSGRFQGALFPFRSGFECGVNRLVYGPDGSLYVGMTNRGWGSRGGKPYGLQRLVYTGLVPFEMHTMKLTKDGFDLTFTKPLDAAAAEKAASFSLISFTHNYGGAYGAPEVDRRAEKIEAVTVSADKTKVSLKVTGFRPGRIYELHADGVRDGDNAPLLHPVGYYTLNEVLQ
jgi:hypothetical protein